MVRKLAVLGAMIVALTGCDTVNQVSSGVDKAGTCATAISESGWVPSSSDPQKAKEEAQQKADKLTNLAKDVQDANLQKALQDQAASLREVQNIQINPQGIADWVTKNANTAKNLATACG
ncbi:hypothetical protein D5S17_11085 [Pseudonocardiaceae bacterium YIM PH 21723]|nr:hypothetical protein D5S17_11085 [Pseudonocardiaceae bacterium YIM PH 21723]